MKFKNMKRFAFSLMEMMVVMVVLSIITAAAAPIITKQAKRAVASSDGVPAGVIMPWGSTVDKIPKGWQLCDGTNGTPDLRSRFVYGSGGDTNSKSAYSNTWNGVNGHFKTATYGGLEVLNLIEKVTPASGDSLTITSNKFILPRFIALAFIMKLPYTTTMTPAATSAP